jgi:Pretoxin HINT domain
VRVKEAPGIAMVGNAVSCGFAVLAGIMDVINTAQNEGFSIQNVATYTVRGAGIALECGAGTRAVKKLYDSCGGSISKQIAFFGAGLAAANIDFLLSYGKSFDGETKIMTRAGYVAIKDIAVGDEVASIDEKTGRKVWRKVTELFSRQAPNTLNVELEDADGKRIKIKTTLEHPFHVEAWDGKVETMLAALNGAAAVDPSRLFPSDGKTPFGDWVNAGALKIGDKVSTRESIPEANNNTLPGPRLIASNDNQPLTVTEIVRDSRAARVYNFEVESRDGEITHNYFVGDDAAWVHNAGFGNSFGSKVPSFLYGLYDGAGNFIRWGITNNPISRERDHQRQFGKSCKLKVVETGTRRHVAGLERWLERFMDGPRNNTPWSGTGGIGGN